MNMQSPSWSRISTREIEVPTRCYTSKDSLYDYFNTLPFHAFSIRDFKQNWRAAMREHFNQKAITFIINETFKFLDTLHKDDFVDLSDFLHSHEGLIVASRKWATYNNYPDPRNLTNILSAFAKGNTRPDTFFLNKWYMFAATEMSNFHPIDLSQCVGAFAKLGIIPQKAFLNNWQVKSQTKLREFDQINLAQSIWAYSVFYNLSGNAEYKNTALNLFPYLGRFEKMPTSVQQQVRDCGLLIGIENDLFVRHEDDRISKSEKDLRAHFQRVGLPVSECQCVLPKIGRAADFLFNFEGRSIVMEYDGPPHFVRDIDGSHPTYNGGTILQTSLMEKFLPLSTTIRLRYMDADAVGLRHTARCLQEAFSSVSNGVFVSDCDPQAQSVIIKPFLTPLSPVRQLA